MLKKLCLLWLPALLLLHPAAFAEQAKTNANNESRSALAGLAEKVKLYTLPNGLRVIMYRRGIAPVFAGVVTVRVGGVDEKVGYTGISHLLEHMAFKGTDLIGTKNYARERVLLGELEMLMQKQAGGAGLDEKETARLHALQAELESLWNSGEFESAYMKRGATGMNATTGSERTNYFLNLPRPSFEFWCWMEAERLAKSVLREFYKERDVVMEERRMRFEDDPSGKLYETLLGTAYLSHPYRNPVIGYQSDISSLTATELADYQKKYYVPANMVVSLVGDIDPEQDIKVVEKYFGRMPAGTPPKRPAFIEPPQAGERELTVESSAAPQFMIAYHKPAFPHPDDAPLSVMVEILAGGKLSPLYTELVKKRRLAASLDSYEAPGAAFPNLMVFDVVPSSPHSNREVLGAFDRVLRAFSGKLVSDEALDRAKRSIAMSYLARLRSNLSLGIDLASAELNYGDWQALVRWYDEMEKVTAADVQRTARQYLINKNRTVALLEQKQARSER